MTTAQEKEIGMSLIEEMLADLEAAFQRHAPWAEVQNILQQAEELGGPEGNEYPLLMFSVIQLARKYARVDAIDYAADCGINFLTNQD